MTCFKGKYRIESTRLKGWDYGTSGFYFVTICVKNREMAFGRVAKGVMEFSLLGEIAYQCIVEIPAHFPNAELDELIVMPNHIHVIVVNKSKICRDAACCVSTGT